MDTFLVIAAILFGIWAFVVFVVVPIGIVVEKIIWYRTVSRAWYLGSYRG